MPEIILPGTYINVRDEGLISTGRVSTGNIGIVGTALKGPIHKPILISSLAEAKSHFGEALSEDVNLLHSLSIIYQNGGRAVYAVRTGQSSHYTFTNTHDGETVETLTLQSLRPGKATEKQSSASAKKTASAMTLVVKTGEDSKTKIVELAHGNIQESYVVKSFAELVKKIKGASKLVWVSRFEDSFAYKLPNNVDNVEFEGGVEPDYSQGLAALENELVNIVLLAGQDISQISLLQAHLKKTAEIKRERIGVIGTALNEDERDVLPSDIPSDDRLILVAPGILRTVNKQQFRLSGGYLAAAIAGLISSLPVQTSPTNKTLVLEGLTTEFNSAQLEKYVQKRMLVVEKRNGFRVVKGITTHDGAWQQVTTRRIVDYAIYGVRSSCDPYIGKLNNSRVRSAMKATLDGFLTRMVDNESLVSYQLEVSATRAQEIAGETMVTMTLMPTFSIDFIKVTMYLN